MPLPIRRAKVRSTVPFALALLLHAPAHAAILKWDGNSAAEGTGGEGNWDTTTKNWFNERRNEYVTWTAADHAIFSTTNPAVEGYKTVTITEPIVVGDPRTIQFEESDYKIVDTVARPPAIQLGGPRQPHEVAIIVAPDKFAWVETTIGGRAPLQFSGGRLYISGNNTYEGGTQLLGGRLTWGYGTPLGIGKVTIVASEDVELLGNPNPRSNQDLDNEIVVAADGAGRVSIGAVRNTAFTQSNYTRDVTLGKSIQVSCGLFSQVRFTAMIQGAGAITKVGPGFASLVNLNGNTYAGGTFVKEGSLFISNDFNSATGDQDIVVGQDNGTFARFGGGGIVTGAVSVTDGAELDPGLTAVLTTGAVAFKTGSSFLASFQGTTPGQDMSQLKVKGTVTIHKAKLVARLFYVPNAGTDLVLIDNDGDADAIMGDLFVDERGGPLPEGARLDLDYLGEVYRFLISYKGNAENPDGTPKNDVVLSFQQHIPVQPTTWGKAKSAFR